MICKKCFIDKDNSDFHKNSSSKTGYQTYCKICSNNIQREFYKKNTSTVLDRKRKYRQTDSYKINNKKYESHYIEVRKVKKKENFNIRFGMVLRDIVRRCLNGGKKQNNTFKILGYDTTKLKQRIETQFKDGMNWGNYGKWHIDHKKPISKFKKGTSLALINSLSNLQPLWAKDNLSKGNKFKETD